MVFNGETNNLDLYSDCRYWCGIENTDVTSYPLIDFARNANFAADRVVSLIFKSDQKWEWDDSNQTDLPIATTSLVANQQDYALAVTHLKILRVRIKDQNGNLVTLEPGNRRDLTDNELTADAGDPKKYDKLGNSVFLHPKPSYASSGGLEIQFQRGASHFIYSDTIKEPGFASQFHRLVSMYAALDYTEPNDMEKRSAKIRSRIAIMEAELVEFYNSRNWDEKQTMSVRQEDYGQDSGFGSGNQDGF